jgi:hypothetical protein
MPLKGDGAAEAYEASTSSFFVFSYIYKTENALKTKHQ